MKSWIASQEEIRKVKKDKELAKSILKMIEVRIREVEKKDKKEFASLVVEDYYEIIKEATTGLMAIDGYKTLSHEVLVGYLKEFFPQFSESEILFIDELRKLRNDIAYKGFFVNPNFIERNELRMKDIVLRLKRFLEERLRN